MCNRTTKQLAGFILFWIGIGMIVMLFMPNNFVGILIASGFMLLGYTLYCKSWEMRKLYELRNLLFFLVLQVK